jgi:two-component system chemotaxis response regulator CheB
MIVDDSALMRKLLSEALRRDSGIEIVDIAMDGQFALDHLTRIRPDVILMDVDMPRLDGLATLDRIVSEYGLPVIMCSSQTTSGAKATIEALARGAVDFIEKPTLAALTSGAASKTMSEKVRAAMGARVRPPRHGLAPAAGRKPFGVVNSPQKISEVSPKLHIPESEWQKAVQQAASLARKAVPEIIGIGTSTGGPPALEQVLSGLPADFPLGIVIVQHMPPGFTRQLASHLDRNCAITVREAVDREMVEPGVALIAPGGMHMRVIKADSNFMVTLDQRTPPVSGHRPSVDVLFESLARNAGEHAAAVIMTGMGSDGAEGLGKMAQAGAVTIAQTPDSCICFGMPKSAIDRGYARTNVPLDGIASAIIACAFRPAVQIKQRIPIANEQHPSS